MEPQMNTDTHRYSCLEPARIIASIASASVLSATVFSNEFARIFLHRGDLKTTICKIVGICVYLRSSAVAV
jgi:hypothetical protein